MDGIVIKFKTDGEQEARIFIHEKSDFQDTVTYSDLIKTEQKNYFAAGVEFDSLKADTKYYYTLSVKNRTGIKNGSFTTLPSGPASFKIAFGSCARTGSDNPIFGTINKLEPLFFMNIGDFHYEDISQNCSYNFARAYFTNLRSHYQSELYSTRPFVYMWDDHDFGPNNSYSESNCRNEAIQAYRHFVPHYSLPFKGNDEPISQVFSVGRVRFVLTDLRSQKKRPEYEGCERVEIGTNFGPDKHLEWFKEQLIDGKDSGQLIAWVNPLPWISDERSLKYECDENDDWQGFSEERNEIANFIKDNNIPLIMLSGDAHMLAIDDGSNSDYATGGGAPIPVFHASPLDHVGIFKGGPYSHGYSRKRGQFGMLEIKDDGGKEICVSFKGMDSRGNIAVNIDGKALTYSFCKEVQSFPSGVN